MGIAESRPELQRALPELPQVALPAPPVAESPAVELGGQIDADDFDNADADRFRRMEIGNWLDFVDKDGKVQAGKLSWVSPISSRLLFVNRRGVRFCVASPEELAVMVRLGRLRAHVDDGAFDSAMQGVIDRLDPGSATLQRAGPPARRGKTHRSAGTCMAVALLGIKETVPGERRVALTPETARKLGALGITVWYESGAGLAAGFTDAAYDDAGARAFDAQRWGEIDILLCVQAPPAGVLEKLKPGASVVGLLTPASDPALAALAAEARLHLFPLQQLPRTTRAQAMDVLSSQAGMAGYKAALIAAERAPRFFPMLTTAAGTVRPAKVLVIGAGVEGFDVRPETREQIQSLGARFLDLGVSAAGEGGYARALTDEERAEQQRRLADHLRGVEVVICTAAVPGRPAPTIVTAAMVDGMATGSVIVDLAAESGGNCALTQPGQCIEHQGVTIDGPLGLASRGATQASEISASIGKPNCWRRRAGSRE
ncbi:hypothetical protein G6F24_012731 [Rhizopus arrhizus]|nr:hypothetical protein G6F24_012731 [Rhizopus arrhizus]